MRDKRTLILQMIGGHEKDILDVGCGSGEIAEVLSGAGKRVVGIERDRVKAAAARPFCCSVVEGDLGDDGTFPRLAALGRQYDIVLCSEVLEHLADPEHTLKNLAPFLKADGALLVVLPNVAFYKNRWKLLRGEWNYQPEGLLDRTHLRFFTKRSSEELLESCSFRISSLQATHYSRRYAPIYDRLVRWWPRLFAEQFVIRAMRQDPSSARPSGG